MSDTFCFGTLAVGDRYRAHAQLLAQDIQRYAPQTSFVVLTDQTAEFAAHNHVVAVPHTLQSVKGFHDKRFVIEKALEHVDVCMYLDSDVRILGPVPTQTQWLPGITARTGCNILKHNEAKQKRKALPKIQHVAQTLAIDLTQTFWFHEFMFTVKKQAGVEREFLKVWQTMSYFFEMNELHDGEGNVMGLAAQKAGLTLQLDAADRFPFFKDNIEKVRVKNGQSSLDDKKSYFETHLKIEYPHRPIWHKSIKKLTRKMGVLYRSLRLKSLAKQDPELQKLL
ncbi:MAG: hypothetical protein WBA57_00325 [Elainellaceae cyanobacterium]